jgi:hypothetical protein
VHRFSLDSNAFDRIAESDKTVELVRRATETGSIQLLSTHVQRDELAAIPDPVRRERVARIPTSDVPTYGFVVGVSRLGMARLGDEARYEAMTGGNRQKHAHDALIAMTAQYEDTVLVSEDRRLRNRAESELGVEAWSWQRFREHLESVTA